MAELPGIPNGWAGGLGYFLFRVLKPFPAGQAIH